MKHSAPPADGVKTRRQIVQTLKTAGPRAAAALARQLKLTAMAVRQHLYALQAEKLVDFVTEPRPVGRPAKLWRLTPAADKLFPDAYAELTVSLIAALETAFGSKGMTAIVEARCAGQMRDYRAQIPDGLAVQEKLKRLAALRTAEGYMAEVQPVKGRSGEFLFVEHHCPICAAAQACNGFCATELTLFRQILGPRVSVERTEHIVNGDRRCAYKVEPAHPLVVPASSRLVEAASSRRSPSPVPDEPPYPTEPALTAGSCALRDPAIGRMVQDALLFFEGARYHLLAWCIMPNHFHCIVRPRSGHTLANILHAWKSFTAKQINQALGRGGAFWEKKSFDHAIRQVEHLRRYTDYIDFNPVVAGLCAAPHDWPLSSRGTGFKPALTALDFHPAQELPFKPVRNRGDLPHLHKPLATYFVTVRLADAVQH